MEILVMAANGAGSGGRGLCASLEAGCYAFLGETIATNEVLLKKIRSHMDVYLSSPEYLCQNAMMEHWNIDF